jgi:hypothetical protein
MKKYSTVRIISPRSAYVLYYSLVRSVSLFNGPCSRLRSEPECTNFGLYTW